MANNRSKVDNLHRQMPAVFNTEVNENWKALIEALGQADQDTMDLIESVRQQFFVKTASRPYIDRLGTANLVQRPRFVGMEDTSFRKFIPIMSYQPKQVKLVLDNLLDLFFFKESTTSFISSGQVQPFLIQDGWELEYNVDSTFTERISFKANEFTNIAAAAANEIVAAINRQAAYSYAIAFENSLTKQTNIKIFSKTIGSKGSIEITGGRADIALQFEGYNLEAGQGVSTEWQVTKVGDTVTLRYTGTGGSPNIDKLQVDDIVIINRPGNAGSFVITRVDPVANTIQYVNLFATPETFTGSAANDVKFFTPFKANIYLKDSKAAVWEVRPGEIVVEIPPSPPVVRRKRVGSAHINGFDSAVISTIDTFTLEIQDASSFPDTGAFLFVPKNEIQTYFPNEMDTTSFKYNGRLSSDKQVYRYASKSGNTLQGITPELPVLAGIGQRNLISADRDSNNIITCTTATTHDYSVGESAIISGAVQGVGSGISTNGAWKILEILSPTQFTCYSFSGSLGAKASTAGTVRTERVGLADTGSRVILSTATLQPRRLGPYLWDVNADFVLSSLTADLTTEIKAGTTKRNIEVTVNDIPNTECKIMFDFGTEKQEGPVRCFYKPNTTSLAIDPSYVFKFTHDVTSAVTMIRRRGGIQFGGVGAEYAGYITDPASARIVLQELMQEVKSVGIFINFLIRYPALYYGTIDVYKSGIDPDTINQ
ncbi:hypothetical protein UFOVP53_229 [uncultured Caudovirales phage]|uniref:Uncharacterized protein n=1 Tax=uncultured Caudovirales phage TaxID=2100421 RepID=A0A6J5KTJ1_9CAUD|nr:hypothetical protein UFOVP53_229 [uncultured Caudovirales phage]